MTRCSTCPNEAVLTPYFNNNVHLCGPCAQQLAERLDDEDLWPPVEFGPLVVIVADDVPQRYDGRELERLCSLQHHYGTRLSVEVVKGRRVLRFRDEITSEAAEIAARHHGLLVSAWEEQATRVIKLCDSCDAPFVLARSNTSRCPVCGEGKRSVVVNIPFMAIERRRAS